VAHEIDPLATGGLSGSSSSGATLHTPRALQRIRAAWMARHARSLLPTDPGQSRSFRSSVVFTVHDAGGGPQRADAALTATDIRGRLPARIRGVSGPQRRSRSIPLRTDRVPVGGCGMPVLHDPAFQAPENDRDWLRCDHPAGRRGDTTE